jgi:multidrug efflux pump subunit AcrA (membrane-fusion protein)/GAF domain-containing protein
MASGIVESQNQQQQPGQQGQQQGPGKRSKLVERLLDASANLPAFMNDLLGTMAVTVAGTEAAGFLIERPEDGRIGLRTVTHIRPDESDEEVRQAAIKAFQEIIVPCIQQNKDGAIDVGSPDEGEPQFCLVTLLRNEGNAVAVAAVITRCRDQDRAKQRLMSMQLVAGYFELYMLRRQMEQSRELAVRHQNVLQLTTSVATAEGFEAAAMNFCNELANRAGASRVSLGWVKGNNIKVRALSHTEKFDKKQELIVQIQRVMEECHDQEEPVRFDLDGTRSENVSREAQNLCRSQGSNSVYSVPLRRRGELVGVVTLEYTPPAKLTDDVANALAVTADLLAPQMYDRHENDRWIPVKVGHSVARMTKLAIGPKHVLAKLIIFAVVAAALVLMNWVPFADLRMMHKISAPFQFVASQKRSMPAPYDGHIEEIYVKPGDRFVKGQVLAEMRTDELRVELEKFKSERDTQLATAFQKRAEDRQRNPNALAEADVALEQAKTAEAQMAKVQLYLDKAKIVAPFDGMVLKAGQGVGDLDDKKGAPVKTGDVLFEIEETGQKLKAELAVPERDIHFIKEAPTNAEQRKDTNGWTGKLATNSLPSEDMSFSVERIVPLGSPDAQQSDNTFKVYVTLDKPAPVYARAGMAGEAKIHAGKQKIGWIWTHRLVDWLRLKLWF